MRTGETENLVSRWLSAVSISNGHELSVYAHVRDHFRAPRFRLKTGQDVTISRIDSATVSRTNRRKGQRMTRFRPDDLDVAAAADAFLVEAGGRLAGRVAAATSRLSILDSDERPEAALAALQFWLRAQTRLRQSE